VKQISKYDKNIIFCAFKLANDQQQIYS